MRPHYLCARLRSSRPEAQDGEDEEQAADQRDDQELWPDYVEAGVAVKDGLRKGHKMRGGRDLHRRREPPKLLHRPRHGSQKYLDRGGEEQVDHHPGGRDDPAEGRVIGF